MKHFMFLVLLFLCLESCQKETISPIKDESSSILVPDSLVSPGGPKAGMVEYSVNPKFGKPSSTYYYFKVYDPAGSLALSVKLFEKATGTIRYLPLTRVGSYWTLSTRIAINGWYDYRYVYSGTKTSISSNAYALCNTRNTFVSNNSSGIHSITWPFGADGSSWYNRIVCINGTYQEWKGGEETKNTPYHIGYGWNEETHVGINEKYSDDWNRGAGSQDLGAIVRSPLDGYIDNIGQYNVPGYGNSIYVAIVQEASNGNHYRFYVGHLQNYSNNLYVGKYVRAGIDQIGNLGSTGASSPHAHTNLRNITNGTSTSVPFYFNAQ